MTWFTWLLAFILAWLCLDVLIIIAIWLFTALIRPRFPNWWRRIIADRDPTENL